MDTTNTLTLFGLRFSVDLLLQERRADPEEILMGLGFGAQEDRQQLQSRIPHRFLSVPSKAEGITLEQFFDRNPDLKEYIELKKTSQSTPVTRGQGQCPDLHIDDVKGVVDYLELSNVPHHFINAWAASVSNNFISSRSNNHTNQSTNNNKRGIEDVTSEHDSTNQEEGEESHYEDDYSTGAVIGSLRLCIAERQRRASLDMALQHVQEYEFADGHSNNSGPGSWSSSSTLTPVSAYYNARLSPNETLV